MTKLTEEQALEVRKLLYHEFRDNAKWAAELQGHYGKWIIASLLLIHGATFIFLASNESLSKEFLPHVFWWPIAGLICALVCGFLTWVNWGLHLEHYQSPEVTKIYNIHEPWPNYNARVIWWINPTFWLSIIAGFSSVGCIVGAAVTGYLRIGA